eukprot:6488425-Amphidinium_carterae.1
MSLCLLYLPSPYPSLTVQGTRWAKGEHLVNDLPGGLTDEVSHSHRRPPLDSTGCGCGSSKPFVNRTAITAKAYTL